MFESAADLIERFLRLQRSLVIETREFRALKHNKDLCPSFQKQLEKILEAYGRFSPIVYDTQGLADDGVDIAVRFERERNSNEEVPRLVGLQLKSFEDCRSASLFKDLKAQRDDAFRKVIGLERYFIVLCTDEKAHKDRVRLVEAEFKTAVNTFVIEPAYALSFLHTSERRIEGLVTRAMQEEDAVFQRALEAVQLPTQSAGVLAVCLAARRLEIEKDLTAVEILNDASIRKYYEVFIDALSKRLQRMEELGLLELEDEDSDRWEILNTASMSADDLIPADLDTLESSMIEVDSLSGEVVLRNREALPLIALLSDAQVRYELDADDLVPYALDALALLEV